MRRSLGKGKNYTERRGRVLRLCLCTNAVTGVWACNMPDFWGNLSMPHRKRSLSPILYSVTHVFRWFSYPKTAYMLYQFHSIVRVQYLFGRLSQRPITLSLLYASIRMLQFVGAVHSAGARQKQTFICTGGIQVPGKSKSDSKPVQHYFCNPLQLSANTVLYRFYSACRSNGCNFGRDFQNDGHV